jgi:hypothetical protein
MVREPSAKNLCVKRRFRAEPHYIDAPDSMAILPLNPIPFRKENANA